VNGRTPDANSHDGKRPSEKQLASDDLSPHHIKRAISTSLTFLHIADPVAYQRTVSRIIRILEAELEPHIDLLTERRCKAAVLMTLRRV
jgi:hypothetical protein